MTEKSYKDFFFGLIGTFPFFGVKYSYIPRFDCISRCVYLLIFQNNYDLIDDLNEFLKICSILQIDLIEYTLEKLFEYTKIHNFRSTYITNVIFFSIDCCQVSIEYLKNLIYTPEFDINFNIPQPKVKLSRKLTRNRKRKLRRELPKQNIGSLTTTICPIIYRMLIFYTKMVEAHNKPNDKQIITEALDFLQDLLIIPIILVSKYQEYDPTLPSQTLATKTAKFQTITNL